MVIQFLGHSGFLVETDHAYLLIDWWKGTLPPMGNKPLYVFVSHSHHDHYNPAIFQQQATFLLANDITPPSGVTAHTLSGNQTLTVDGITVETLPSTDQGVAFVITLEGRTLYHSGDLHWWHWEGEPDPWNPNMEREFKAYSAPLKGRQIDVAFVPLDSRLGKAEDWGLVHLLELAAVDTVIPMHQWGDDAPNQRFCANHPQWAPRLRPIALSERITL